MEKQYIIVPRSGVANSAAYMQQCLDTIKSRSDISIRRIVGEEDNPKRIIIAANPEAANELLRNFGDGLIIEEDQALRY
jgi:hypothetical protein